MTTKQTGLINVICGCGQNDRSGGGALGGAIGGIAVLGLLLYGAYRFADSALAGARDSTAAANHAVGVGVAVLLGAGGLAGAGWVLLARRRQVRDAPLVAEFTARTTAALEAHKTRQALPPGQLAPQLPPAGPQRIHAQRVDRIEAAP